MKKDYCLILLCCFALLAGSCGKGVPSAKDSSTSEPKAAQSAENLPAVSFETVVVASGKATSAQLYAEKSVPAMPGTKVDLVDVGVSPPQAIVTGVIIQAARWKVPGPFQAPKYPASGFVTLSMAENQWAAIKGKNITVQLTNRKSPTR